MYSLTLLVGISAISSSTDCGDEGLLASQWVSLSVDGIVELGGRTSSPDSESWNKLILMFTTIVPQPEQKDQSLCVEVDLLRKLLKT